MDKRELKADELMVCYDRIIEEVEPEFRSQVSRRLGILHARQVTVMVEGSPFPVCTASSSISPGKKIPSIRASSFRKRSGNRERSCSF